MNQFRLFFQMLRAGLYDYEFISSLVLDNDLPIDIVNSDQIPNGLEYWWSDGDSTVFDYLDHVD